MALVYRIYGSQRLSDISPWVEAWALDSMFAGIPGRGAEDAWWLTSLGLEDTMLGNNPITGGGADIRKRFDAIVRQLVYLMLWIAGCPPGINRAYKNMMENMVIYNSISGGLGGPHQRRCGIPQGCPFSVMIIALHMRPWLIIMESIRVQPRVLADDVLLYARGEWHLERFVQGYIITLQYIQDMGAKTAPEKSFVFSTNEGARKWVKTYVWPIINQTVTIILHTGDLGAHLNTCRRVASTSTARIYEATAIIRRIRFLPHQYGVKAMVIRTKAFTKGPYGCEAVHVNETALRAMQTATVEAIGPVHL